MSDLWTFYRAMCVQVVVLAIVAISCTAKVDYGDSVYACADSDICPSGQLCVDELCIVPCTQTSCSEDQICTESVCKAKLVQQELLNYSFDDYPGSGLIHDRSGNRLDGFYFGTSTQFVQGRFGTGIEFSDADEFIGKGLRIPYHETIFSNKATTIELFVLRDESGQQVALYGNQSDAGVEYALEITEDDTLRFLTNRDCGEMATFGSTGTIQPGVWQHLAVTWDGEFVRFYINGVASGEEPHKDIPCPVNSKYHVGVRFNGSGHLIGMIDELKVSNFAKSESQIAASMMYDSTQDFGVCGDRLLEREGESCIADTQCCSSSCQPLTGTPCGNGECSDKGACRTDGGRATEGLLLLYEFGESSGPTIADTSGSQTPIDLTIQGTTGVNRKPGSLEVTSNVIIASTTSTRALASAVVASNEFSIEAWIAPANTTQDGPSRIFTMSENSSRRNFTLGQHNESYLVRITTTRSGTFAEPIVDTPVGDLVVGAKTHLVLTRNSEGVRRMYVNGVLRSETSLGGFLNLWEDDPFSIANEFTGGRPWLGEFFLIAMYDRSLSVEEVSRNYSAGSD